MTARAARLLVLPVAAIGVLGACETRTEETDACTTRVQTEAFRLALEAAACKPGDRCEIVRWEVLLGRRGCARAFACHALFPAGTDTRQLAAAAAKLAAQLEACGACGVAGCAAADAAVCDVDAGRCVLAGAGSGNSTAPGSE